MKTLLLLLFTLPVLGQGKPSEGNCRVIFVSKTLNGHGNWMDEATATAWVRHLNQFFPELNHKVECVKPSPVSSAAPHKSELQESKELHPEWYAPAGPYPLHDGGSGKLDSSRSISGLTGIVSLDASGKGSSKNENQCYKFNPKFLIFPGVLLLLSGVIFLYKLWWKISFDFYANVTTIRFVGHLLLSFFLFQVGGIFMLVAFGCLP